MNTDLIHLRQAYPALYALSTAPQDQPDGRDREILKKAGLITWNMLDGGKITPKGRFLVLSIEAKLAEQLS